MDSETHGQGRAGASLVLALDTTPTSQSHGASGTCRGVQHTVGMQHTVSIQ